MSIFGNARETMKHRLACVCLLAAALLPMMSCDPPAQEGPGTVTVSVSFNPAAVRSFDRVDINWIGSVSPALPANEPRNLGLGSVNTTKTIFSQGGVLEPQVNPETITDRDIHAGAWTFTVTVTGTRSGTTTTIVPATVCNQRVAHLRATTIGFTQGGTGCTCTMGCS